MRLIRAFLDNLTPRERELLEFVAAMAVAIVCMSLVLVVVYLLEVG